jgi:hypothetical protein
VFPTQSYISDEKEITPVFPAAGQKFLKYFEQFLQFFPIFKNLYLFIYSKVSRVSENSGWETVV